MQIEWKTKSGSPYLSRQAVERSDVRIHRVRVQPGRMLEHTNDFHELNMTLGGTLVTEKLSASGKRLRTRCHGGNLCIAPAGQPISAEWNGPLDNMGFSLDPEFVARTAAENHFSTGFEFVEFVEKKDPLIENIGLALLAETGSDSSSGRIFADSLIQTLTLHLLTNYTTAAMVPTPNGGLSGYNLRRVKEFIDANLDGDLSLADIAAVAELSQYHFARAFRRSTGFTPQQYVMQQRIERAKHLLTDADLPLVEVGLRGGLQEPEPFHNVVSKVHPPNAQVLAEFEADIAKFTRGFRDRTGNRTLPLP